ncbi:MAG: tRNA (adenosine(37)-N6)-threonylcarbamoyltransferase complex dimerization subunit type 1 TsaB [bacterium]|nr:tRNA (adenosine(37)-N6)-threonylcarbamoyltransferase complex dimerization subunit type 1 TsaB [bacterium]
MSFYLAIDTSGPQTFVSIGSSKVGFVSVSNPSRSEETGFTEDLPCIIQDILSSSSKKWSDISALVIGSGPGSFTGLRVGLSYLKGIAYGLSIPIYQIPSLMGFAAEFKNEAKYIISISNAQREELFVSIFHIVENRFVPKSVTEIVPILRIESWVQGQIKDCSLDQLKYVGFAEEEITGIQIALPSKVTESLICLAEQGSLETFDFNKIAQLEPIYLRKVNARTIAERAS